MSTHQHIYIYALRVYSEEQGGYYTLERATSTAQKTASHMALVRYADKLILVHFAIKNKWEKRRSLSQCLFKSTQSD